MAIMMKSKERLQRPAVISYAVRAWCFMYLISLCTSQLDLESTRRSIEEQLEHALKLDKGTGCLIPRVDPFSSEATKFDEKLPRIQCIGKNWVQCYHSHCKVDEEIKETVGGIMCQFQDILYHSDHNYTIGPAVLLEGDKSYELIESDHVKVSCTGTLEGKELKWSGNTPGFRKIVPKKPPPGRENTFNVLILGFDSTSRNGFIRRMPKSWQVLNEESGATVLEGYNVVGEGTPAALIPILTGKTELELPDARSNSKNGSVNVDSYPFIFYKVEEKGYRTAFFEDWPEVGTFNFRLNGWNRQPVDHYLRAFLLEKLRARPQRNSYCVGDTPQYKLLMDVTEQFMELEGKRFVFTFISDITHDNFNMIQTADEDMARFLKNIQLHSEDTLIVVMSDHGPRSSKNAKRHNTLQGKFEERQPLMALRLPNALTRAHPAALAALEANARALSTPHDLHATLLDVLGMTQHWNPYRVPGADLKRGLTMLEPIPRNRSCSEAGIEPQWCACVTWQTVSMGDPVYSKAALALLAYINDLISNVRSLCVPRTLVLTEWVQRQRPNNMLLTYSHNNDADGFTSTFKKRTEIAEEIYQIMIVVDPGRETFQALMTYVVKKKQFLIKTEDILRINDYKYEPGYVPLNSFCYFRN